MYYNCFPFSSKKVIVLNWLIPPCSKTSSKRVIPDDDYKSILNDVINDVADSDTFNPINVQNKRLPFIDQIYIESDEDNDPINDVNDNRNLVQNQGKLFASLSWG